MTKPGNAAAKLGLGCAVVHLAAFAVTVAYVAHSRDGQAPMVWVLFGLLDFPISLLYFTFREAYSQFVHTVGSETLRQLLYLPHLIHGVLATIWWFFLPRLVMPQRLGGVWRGARINGNTASR